MASRRTPLSSNPNAANSPIRPNHPLFAKNSRIYTRSTTDRDPLQQPPAKKQALNDGRQRHLTYREASLQAENRTRGSTYEAKLARERSKHAEKVSRLNNEEHDSLRQWKSHHRNKFPRFVFYFEKVPENERYKFAKQLALLGAREEKFFSIEITHVITTRLIPPEIKKDTGSIASEQDQPQTINPSLLSRTITEPATQSSRKNLIFENSLARRSQSSVLAQDEKKSKPRSTDVLHRAREMGKKIWALEKFERVLEVLLETDEESGISRGGAHGGQARVTRTAQQPNLLQLLQNERVNGPADRDPTAAAKELHFFSGPYIYIYDVNEKVKPIMVREYKKVAYKADGDWPQFRSVAGGRCPFVEDADVAREARLAEKERAKKKAKAREVRATSASVTGKRTLAQMEEEALNRAAPPRAVFEPLKPSSSRDLRQNAFTSRAMAPRLLAGEPVASGMQQSKITSAIRSQVISSNTGTLGAKASTSKEVQGLQRAVLKRQTSAMSQEVGSRPLADSNSHDGSASSRSFGGVNKPRQARDKLEEYTLNETVIKKPKPTSQVVVKSKKRDPKPGYCENCQDKFEDFDEHIDSRKHRRFAENDTNWLALDDLLSHLDRPVKRATSFSLS